MAKRDKKNQLPGDGNVPEQDRMSRYGVRRESKKVKKREAVIRILLIILVLLLIFLSVMFGCSSYINERREYDEIIKNAMLDAVQDIKSFDDLADKLKDGSVLMAMGNSDVPVGQYTQKILAFYGLDEEKLAKDGVITYGTNVKEVTTQVTEASVDCGVVYCTDAFSAGLTPVDYATKEMCGQVIYPAAVLNVSKNQEAAKEFLAYLQTDEAMKVFEAVGFASVA